MIDSTKLIKLIKKVVREEVRSTISSLLKERVEIEVNKILAERFVASIGAGSAKVIPETKQPQPPQKPQPSQKQINESRKRDLLKKMGVDENPMMQSIFEDVEIPTGGQVVSIGGNQIVMDDDDEGIDLSIFGMGS